MANSNDLKEGVVFKEGNDTYVVIKYAHIKKGRGQATIRIKVKNIVSGTITELTYTNEQKVELADVSKQTAQFLYSDDTNSYFMKTDDYSQFSLPNEGIEKELNFIKEGEKVITTFLEDAPVSIEIPKVVELKVASTSGAVAGNTATGAMKDAILETDYKIQVPLFINEGDTLKINTETAQYVSRVN